MINLGRGFFREVSLAATPLESSREIGKEGRRFIQCLTSVTPVPTEEQIARRAYVLYLARGSGSGCDVDDWLAEEAGKDLSASCYSSPPKVRTVAAGQGRSALVSEADSKRASPAHHDRIDAPGEFSSSS